MKYSTKAVAALFSVNIFFCFSTYANQAEHYCGPGHQWDGDMCRSDPSTVPEKAGGLGEWPSHLFVGSGSIGPIIHDVGGGGGAFIGNPGTVAQGEQNAAETDCNNGSPPLGNPILPSTDNKIEPETDFVTTGEMPLFLKRTGLHRNPGHIGDVSFNGVDLDANRDPDIGVQNVYKVDRRHIYGNNVCNCFRTVRGVGCPSNEEIQGERLRRVR